MSQARIVSLLSAGTDIVAALGCAGDLVAIGHECDDPSPLRNFPRVTRSRIDANASSGEIDRQVKELLAGGAPLYEIDAAAIRRLRPTVILTQAQCPVCAVSEADVRALVAADPTLAGTRIVTLLPHSLKDVERDIVRVALALNVAVAAKLFFLSWHARIDAVRRYVDGRKKRVALIEWTDPVMLAGNWLPELLALAGGECPFTKAGKHSPYVELETILEWRPQEIVIAPCGFDLRRAREAFDEFRKSPVYAAWAKTQRCPVHVFDGNLLFNRSGPGLIDTLECLAAAIWDYPEHRELAGIYERYEYE